MVILGVVREVLYGGCRGGFEYNYLIPAWCKNLFNCHTSYIRQIGYSLLKNKIKRRRRERENVWNGYNKIKRKTKKKNKQNEATERKL